MKKKNFLCFMLGIMTGMAITAGLWAVRYEAARPTRQIIEQTTVTPWGMCPTEDSCRVRYQKGRWMIWKEGQ